MQIESPAAVYGVHEIAAVDRIDVLFIGLRDLSFATGILAEFDHPEFGKAVRVTAEAAQQHGKTAGILLPAGHSVETYHALGFRFLVSGSDAMALNQGTRTLVQPLQEQIRKLSRVC